jgi:tRNA(Ile)-lysidine synthase
LEHRLWGILKEDQLLSEKLLLACSGGADSVAMIRAFAAVRPASLLAIAFVHHGEGENHRHRDEAEDFVRELAGQLKISFVVKSHSGPVLKSEAELRDVRRTLLVDARKESGSALIVTAHHAQDLLETRMIRLLRGTGPDGLKAIHRRRDPWYRPWLEVPPQDLRDYLGLLGQSFCEDPTNTDPKYMRNWLRHCILPQFESYRPGSLKALGRSMEDITKIISAVPKAESSPKLSRQAWQMQSKSEQMQSLAQCLRHVGVTNFTRGQLEEIHRRMDISRKEHSFAVAGCLWLVNAQQIEVQPL